MSTMRHILGTKGTQVLSVGPNASALEAAVLMNEHKIGSLVVLDEGRLIGIITERDILHRIVVPRLDPGHTPVQEVMSTELICCQPHTTIEEARGVMMHRRIRHLPVVDPEHNLLGLISIGDLNAWQANDHEHTIQILHDYIYGRV